MPSAPLKPCTYPGCARLVTSGRCEDHPLTIQATRDPERQKLYDRKWQRRRRLHLSASPWCAECLRHDVYTAATDVHHLVPHRGDSTVFMTSPLESLCHECHSRITQAEGRGGPKVFDRRVSSVGGHPRENFSQCEESA